MDLGKLDVIVVSCRGLRAADRLSGKSDPYVVINFGDKMEQTEVVKKDLNPVFKGAKYAFEVTDKEEELVVSVFDKDKGPTNDDFLGQIVISLKDLDSQKPIDKWYKLLNASGQEDPTVKGDIRLKMHYTFSQFSEYVSFFGADAPPDPADIPNPEFSTDLLTINATTTYNHIAPVIWFFTKQTELWYWTNPSQSILGFCIYIVVSLNNTLLPVIIPLWVAVYMMYLYVLYGGRKTSADADDLLEDIPEDDGSEGGGILSAYRMYKAQLRILQNSLGQTNESIQGFLDLFNWRYPEITIYVLYGMLAVSAISLFLPFRYILFVATLYLYTRYTIIYSILWRLWKGIVKSYYRWKRGE